MNTQTPDPGRATLWLKKALKYTTLYLLILSTTMVFSYLGFLIYYKNRIYPGVWVGGIKVGNFTPSYAQTILISNFGQKITNPIILKDDQNNQTYQINLKSAKPEIPYDKLSRSAYMVGRTGNLLVDLQQTFQALTFGKTIVVDLSLNDPRNLNSQIDSITQAATIDPIDATITIDGKITPSSDGITVDTQQLIASLKNYLTLKSPAPQTLPLKTLPPYFSTQRANLAASTLSSFKNKPLLLKHGPNTWIIDQKTLFTLLDTKKTASITDPSLSDETRILNSDKLANYLTNLSSKIYKPMHNARFSVDPNAPTIKVTEFQAAQDGQELDLDQTQALISQSLFDPSKREVDLPVKTTRPTITTQSVNNLGIEKSIGEGVSYFAGSITNRIYNIGLAASRINGTLVAPGETFSFVNTIGDISAATGYKQAYVIKSGKTVLDDGGGVCQVSTTLFRAVLNSGLPVIARTAHAYRVGYYEQGFPPGLDATVFYPSVDFKFKNDTGNYILIQAITEGTALKVNLYGKPDGRVATVSTPVVSNYTPAPPELRQDDPTLPKGTVKQVDFAAPGANVRFNRTVVKEGKTIIDESFYSAYKPWQAVFLIGTQ